MFKIYLTKETIKDDYNDGEIGRRTIWTTNEMVGEGKSIEAALDQIWENEAWGLAGTWRNNLGLMNDEEDCHTLMFCQTENSGGYKASDEQIEQWKNGKRDLFAAYYFLNIKEEHTVTRDEMANLDLAEY